MANESQKRQRKQPPAKQKAAKHSKVQSRKKKKLDDKKTKIVEQSSTCGATNTSVCVESQNRECHLGSERDSCPQAPETPSQTQQILAETYTVSDKTAKDVGRSLLKPNLLQTTCPVTVNLRDSDHNTNTQGKSSEKTAVKSEPQSNLNTDKKEVLQTKASTTQPPSNRKDGKSFPTGSKDDANSLAQRLSPLQVTRTPRPPNTVCPIIKRKSNYQYPGMYYGGEELSFSKHGDLGRGMAKSMAEAQRYIPVASYPSTVVTMTNNMATIRKHHDLTSSGGASDNSESKIFDLINNVLKGEKQISSVFASMVDPSEETTPGDTLLNFYPDDEQMRDNPGEVATKKNRILKARRKSKLTEKREHDGLIGTGSSMKTNSIDDEETRAAVLNEKKPKLSHKVGNEQLTNLWRELSDSDREPYLARARLAMIEPHSNHGISKRQKQMDAKPRKRSRPSATISNTKVKTEPEEKQAKFSNRDFSNTLVLTVTHPPVNPQSTVSHPSTVNQSMSSTKFRGPVTGSQTCLKVEKTGEKRHKPFRKLTHMKEDYGNFQQAQQFYSLPGRLQEAYLEREILECRRFMSGPQCIRMLNDYREEYTQVCKNFVSSNNLVSSRSHQENLDVIHRSILYNKIQTHKQQALSTIAAPYLTNTPSKQNQFDNLVYTILEAGAVPAHQKHTHCEELTEILEVLEAIPTYPTPDESLTPLERSSPSYQQILLELKSTSTENVTCQQHGVTMELGAINKNESWCDIPTLLTMSNSELDVHLD